MFIKQQLFCDNPAISFAVLRKLGKCRISLASSSSRDSLSHYMSTGICHCLNVTAQLIISSGWPARVPNSSPVAAGAAMSMESAFSVCLWNSLPEMAWSLGGHSMWPVSRKVRVSPESVLTGPCRFQCQLSDHFSGQYYHFPPPSSIIPEFPVMCPDSK